MRELESRGLIVQVSESGPWRIYGDRYEYGCDNEPLDFLSEFMSNFSKEIGFNIRGQVLNHIHNMLAARDLCGTTHPMVQSDIFKNSGLDWGDKLKSPSSKQQFWIVAALNELEEIDKIEKEEKGKFIEWGIKAQDIDEFASYLYRWYRAAKVTDDSMEGHLRYLYDSYVDGRFKPDDFKISYPFTSQDTIVSLLATATEYRCLLKKLPRVIRPRF